MLVQIKTRIISSFLGVSLGALICASSVLAADVPVVKIVGPHNVVNEQNQQLSFYIEVSRPLKNDLNVNLVLTGTATADVDYALVQPTYTIRAGARAALVFVKILDDAKNEVDETINLNIEPSEDYAIELSASQKQITVRDDDPEIYLRATRINLVESIDAQFEFDVVLSKPVFKDISIPFIIAGTAVEGVDYGAVPHVVQIAAGETSVHVQIPVLNDALVEEPKTIEVQPDIPMDKNSMINFFQKLTFNLSDDDVNAELSVSTKALLESSDSSIVYTVKASQPVVRDTEIQIETSGVALEGVDYRALKSLWLHKDEQTASGVLKAIDDNMTEGDEMIRLSLGASSVEVILVDDDKSEVVTPEGIRLSDSTEFEDLKKPTVEMPTDMPAPKLEVVAAATSEAATRIAPTVSAKPEMQFTVAPQVESIISLSGLSRELEGATIKVKSHNQLQPITLRLELADRIVDSGLWPAQTLQGSAFRLQRVLSPDEEKRLAHLSPEVRAKALSTQMQVELVSPAIKELPAAHMLFVTQQSSRAKMIINHPGEKLALTQAKANLSLHLNDQMATDWLEWSTMKVHVFAKDHFNIYWVFDRDQNVAYTDLLNEIHNTLIASYDYIMAYQNEGCRLPTQNTAVFLTSFYDEKTSGVTVGNIIHLPVRPLIGRDVNKLNMAQDIAREFVHVVANATLRHDGSTTIGQWWRETLAEYGAAQITANNARLEQKQARGEAMSMYFNYLESRHDQSLCKFIARLAKQPVSQIENGKAFDRVIEQLTGGTESDRALSHLDFIEAMNFNRVDSRIKDIQNMDTDALSEDIDYKGGALTLHEKMVPHLLAGGFTRKINVSPEVNLPVDLNFTIKSNGQPYLATLKDGEGRVLNVFNSENPNMTIKNINSRELIFSVVLTGAKEDAEVETLDVELNSSAATP